MPSRWKRRQVAFNVGEEQYKQIVADCKRKGQPISAYLRQIIYLDLQKKEKKGELVPVS